MSGKKIKLGQYKPQDIEKKWQAKWQDEKIYQPNLDSAKKPYYNLMMFPYPSAEGLHAGNMYAFTGADIYGRYQRMKGFDVFEPIGLDGFGIHSENYALSAGKHPMDLAKVSEKNFYRQLKEIGNSYDWSRTVETYDPSYYKWTQWIFIQMFKKGLAVRKKAAVNFCSSCETVLADEQVIDNKCERCESEVVKKELEQWFFKITDYAERLLNNTPNLNWSEKVKTAQVNWIGKSEGMEIKFKVQDSKLEISVFTTRPDTLFGANFLVVSPEHPIVKTFISKEKNKKEIEKYIEDAEKKTERERMSEGKEKTGIFSGIYAINPLNNQQLPIWIADYVLMGYGTGAIMAVPAHDQRDFEFAKKYDLPITQVIKGKDVNKEAYTGGGEIVNSNEWNGWQMPKEIAKVYEWLGKKGIGKKETHFHLRDWLISRQRYWGPPIPMIYCKKCDWQPVPEEDLPVKLPYIENYRPIGANKSPLATHPEFYNTTCPKCRGEARRETDVSDTFLDSSWYFFRYLSTEFEKEIFSKERVKKWLPVDMYIGGAEHAVLHLLYSRFMTMFFRDLGLIDFEEPYKRFFAHGLLIKEGVKMSKSKGNIIVPDTYINKYGADTIRCYLMFLGQFSQGGDFYDTGIEGMNRFLNRVWKFSSGIELNDKEDDKQTLKMIHKTIKGVTEDIERLSYNTSIAKLMEFYNFIIDKKTIGKDTLIDYLKLIAPFAPFIAEEIYQSINSSAKFSSIHAQLWPEFDPNLIKEEEITVVIQINGKTRGTITVQAAKIKEQKEIEELAKESRAKNFLKDKNIKKTIYVEGKIVNFVTD